MWILHGDNTIQSRERLVELITQAKNDGKTITRLPAKQLSEAELELALGANSLFGEERLIVIEELHSLPTSARKKQLIAILSTASEDPGTPACVLWEKRSLTKTMLKAFPNTQVKEYKMSKVLFRWLDSLSGQGEKKKQLELLHQAVKQDGEFFVFTMLCRQIRMLIQAADGHPLKGAPFMISKLKKQSSTFTLAQLLRLHKHAYDLDLNLKTSGSPLTLAQQLDLFVLKL